MTTAAVSAFGVKLLAGDFTTGTGGIHAYHIAAAGTGYSVNDVLTDSTDGTGGTFKVTAAPGGTVTEVQQLTFGTGYAVGDSKDTTSLPSSGRSGCQLHITSLCVPIAEVKNVTPGAFKSDAINCTSMDSTWAEFIPGVKDAGEVGISGNFLNAASQAALLVDQIAGTIRTYLIAPSTITWLYTVDGFVTGLPIEAKFDAALSFSCAIKCSGAATLGDAPLVA